MLTVKEPRCSMDSNRKNLASWRRVTLISIVGGVVFGTALYFSGHRKELVGSIVTGAFFTILGFIVRFVRGYLRRDHLDD